MSRLALVLALTFCASTSRADSIVPAPAQAGHDGELLARAETWWRVQQGVLSLPVGFGLEAFVSRADARTTIETFVASGQYDFEAATGAHPYTLIDFYEESGDLGMFGGVQAAGDAWRYAVLRDSGAPAAEVDAARAALLRALDGLHWQVQITGEPGILARGIMRITPEPGDPPIPGPIPTLIPLFAADGSPLPLVKTPVWRADNSGELPFLIWMDDCSKDQIDGYVLALGAMYDAIVDDSTIDRSYVIRLAADALAIGRRLLRRVPVSDDASAELVIMDADGRPTSFHDLSAEEIVAGEVLPRPTNGFNGLMGLGILRTLYHITSDREIGEFYYQELIGNRDYLRSVEDTVHIMYVGTMTNYSNVNMAFVAAWGLLRYETDPVIRARLVDILRSNLYAPGVDREARGLGQPFFDFMYAGFHGGLDAEGRRAIDEGTSTLREHPAAPVWDPAVINCDEAEIAAGSCVGVDGATTMTIAASDGRGGGVVAVDPLPMRIRPPSNFMHRSDPHSVNGGGSDRLNPAGDMHAAYWMGRLLEASGDLEANISPHAVAPLPWTPPPLTDAGVGADGGMGGGDGGCGCRATRSSSAPGWLVFLALAWVVRKRAVR